MRSQLVNLRLSPEVVENVKRLAKSKCVNWQAMMELAICEYSDENPSKVDTEKEDIVTRNNRILSIVMESGCYSTYLEMAKDIGYSNSQISKIRNGKVEISSAFIRKIHDYLGIPMNEIRQLLK